MTYISLIALVLGLFSGSVNTEQYHSNVKVGDVFLIGQVENHRYKYINFPKANFIIKKGGIVNYTNIISSKVEVVKLSKSKDGRRIATIKYLDNRSFFKSHKYVTVDIEDALNQKELIPVG